MMSLPPQKSVSWPIGKRDAHLKDHIFDIGGDGILMLTITDESMDETLK